MKATALAIVIVLVSAASSPVDAQFGSLGSKLGKVADAVQDITFSESEEVLLGSEISTKLRDKYGVVQDQAVHKYVTLVGTVLATASTRPNLKWTFIVLDTDGVNAFAAPGGFVHVTRGALALIHNEAELADVLGHEIGHVTAKHTINAIQKSKSVSAGAQASGREKVARFAQLGYETVLENNFDRKQEMEADKIGVTLANGAGYAPTGLAAFLTRLSDRNKNLKDRSGLFASHPETKARLDGLNSVISSAKLAAPALVAARYAQAISYKPVPVSAVNSTASGPSATSASSSSGSGGKLGLGGITGLGREKSSDQTVSSAGSRGVNPDRDAAGGPVKTLVAVSVTAAEVGEFKKGVS